MFSKYRSCGCRGFQRCKRCNISVAIPKIYINEIKCTGKPKSVFKIKHRQQAKYSPEHHEKHQCRSDDCEKHKCKCSHCEKDKCKCVHCEKDKCKEEFKCLHCEKQVCKCEHNNKLECKWDDCEELNGDSNIVEMICEYEDIHKDNCVDEHKLCPEEIKGIDLCRKKEELRYFKHCSPISQPCDCNYYNHFTSRSNLDFSGLIVVKNTGNPASGCSMEVRVTDIAGSAIVATVSPGASVPIFVECLRSLDIACFKNESVTETCSGEVIFDLEYCTTRYVSHRYE